MQDTWYVTPRDAAKESSIFLKIALIVLCPLPMAAIQMPSVLVF